MRNLARLLLPTVLVLGLLIPLPARGQQVVTLDVTPEVENRATAQGGSTPPPHTLTATAPANTNVDFGITAGPGSSSVPIQNQPPFLAAAKTCNTGMTGSCTVTFDASATPGTTEICAWMRDANPGSQEADCTETKDDPPNEGDDTDRVDINWINVVLDVGVGTSPAEETGAPPPGTQVTLTAEIRENVAQNPKFLAANVDFEIIGGPNKDFNKNIRTADLECDTDAATGLCSQTYTGSATPGIDQIRAHIDFNDATTGAGDEIPGEADDTEQRDATTSAGGGKTPEPDRTDVVEVNWGGTPAPTPSGKLSAEDFCNKERENAAKKEILLGDEFANRICGFGGNDSIKGLTGNDVLLGGEGDDNLKGGEGNDKLNGGPGKKDVAIGAKGKDTCTASEKALTCEGPKKKKKKKGNRRS